MCRNQFYVELFHTVLCRVLVTHVEEFHDQAKEVVSHIPSKHASRMSSKSEVVCKVSDDGRSFKHVCVCVCVCVCVWGRGGWGSRG